MHLRICEHRIFLIALAICSMFLAVPAFAGTLAFDGYGPRSEDGFLFDDSGTYHAGGSLYLHNDSGVTTTSFTRQDGQQFSVHGAEIWGYSLLYQAFLGPQADGNTDYEFISQSDGGPLMHLKKVALNYMIEGFRDGVLVARIEGEFLGYEPKAAFDFGDFFSSIDTLRVSLKLPEEFLFYAGYFQWPSASDPIPGPPGVDRPLDYVAGDYACYEWCGALYMDNLSYTVVPLPATLPLLGGSLMLLGWARRRRR